MALRAPRQTGAEFCERDTEVEIPQQCFVARTAASEKVKDPKRAANAREGGARPFVATRHKVLCRSHRTQEVAYFNLQPVAFGGQRLRGRQHLGGRRSGLGGAALHVGDVRRHLHGALGRPLHIARDFPGRRALLFHRGGNARGNLRHPADGVADVLDGTDRFLVAAWMPEICWLISPVAFAVCSASAFTSEATTAKPRPASPARAASMVAFSASRLV